MTEPIGPLALKALNGQIERAKELHALVEKLTQERESLKLQVRAYEKAINAHCSCGGNGPGDGCVACEIYHDATGTKRSEA